MANTIKHSIPGQVSSYINDEYPLFVEFISAYYEWLESDDSPYKRIDKHLSYLDFKDSLDEYTSLLKHEYLNSIPEKVLVDKELLIRYSKQFYQSLGTEKSFKFLFKIIYGEDVSLYYPKVDMLRVSAGNWIDDESLMCITARGDVDSFLYKRISQSREIYPGVFESAYATVNKITKRYSNKFNFAEISLTDIEGTFRLDQPVEVNDECEWIIPICDGVTVVNSGMNYVRDNVLQYNGSPTFDIELKVTTAGIVDSRYTTILDADELYVERNSVQLTGFTYDGLYISHPDLVFGDTVMVRFPTYKGFIVVKEVDEFGGIYEVNVIDTPFGILTNESVLANDGGSGGVVELKPSLIRKIPGYYASTDGFLSSDKKLQDSDYYQDFSYVVRAGIDVDKYKDVVLKILHPAGMKFIGEVSIIELLKLFMRDIQLTIDIKALGDVILESSVDLYNNFGFIDDWKYHFEPATYKTDTFKNMKVSDVVNKRMRNANFHDSSITIV
jgi:hypothetical protein